jgi:hypothetical protein
MMSGGPQAGTVEWQGIDRLVLRRDLDENLAPARDLTVGIRVGP